MLRLQGWKKVWRDEGGFTLVELLVVAAILAVMASLLAPKVLDALNDSKVKAAVADADSIRQAMERYLIDNNDYPAAADITDYTTLSNQLSKYMNFPDAAKASFTFDGYTRNAGGSYTLTIKAKDKDTRLITVTPNGVTY